ncbi:hypothetical protein EMIT0373P_50043 [Pseudomonas chlororaphis]
MRYGGCAQGTLCALGSWSPGLPTCVQPPPFRLVAIRGGTHFSRS